MSKKSLSKKGKIIVISVVAFLVVAGLAVGAILVFDPFGNKNELVKNVKKDKPKEEEPKITIVDVDSKSRNYAVMVNNINEARTVQSGLNKAYIVYELIAEGGITRYLALFRDVEDVEIGSVRSSRHYYIDYVLENDAIYAHFGWSPQAEEDIRNLHIENINGLTYDGTYYYRITKIGAPHNAFTTMALLKEIAEKRGYSQESDKKLLLDYSGKSVDLSKHEAVDANEVNLVYSNYTKNTYKYNDETKRYTRYVGGNVQIDHEDESELTVKNIIAYKVRNYSIAGDPKGRQMLDNIGSGEGYYITEGKAVPITWEKKDRASQTVYKYKDGTEITVNDGNTWIQIVPSEGSIELG